MTQPVGDSEQVYAALAAHFDITFTDVRGGVSLTYITGEQVIARLNDVLGVGGWTFRVLQHDIHTEADEVWVLGELVALIGEASVTKQQFGSQKLKRSRSTGGPLDIGFDLKGATTDSLKKCASLLGVGLYLSRREAPPRAARPRPSVPLSKPGGVLAGSVQCAQCGESNMAHGGSIGGRLLCGACYSEQKAKSSA